ncbi:DUF4837 family protein [Cyclobacterium qasimii]|uniref:DUF4837 domain-containing protein n=2 Tax=Cyclobacterium qasimii TaxID=1350429 RepID=S7WUY7_9BACT|nr:DUF4837 family protein [Cyclobacterium qasimii]EPR67903.1 hypothetical protein ADICYQ_2975 [Cyclobacterium qasimii M12-11B]GEO23073.1 hypothetical protein CQA01_36070 [Cyclobacterium qasimii]
MSLRFCIIALFSALIFAGCESNTGANSDSNKPKARGTLGEIILVIDSTKYAGPVGDALKNVFESNIEGIIREESMFYMRKVDPRKMTRILKMASNIIFVTTFDDRSGGSRTIANQFTPESIEKSKADSSIFMLRNQNEFAVGQEVLYLFGENEPELIKNIEANKQALQNLFSNKEKEILSAALFSRKNGEVSEMAKGKFGVELSLPASYQFVKEEENFIWCRQPTPRIDKPDISVFFYQTAYEDESQVFPENIIKLRDEITRNTIFGDPEQPESFVVTEKQQPPIFRNIRIDGQYSTEMRGSWKTNNLSMGGSFLSYTVVDEEKGMIFYMEGFVYYPNEAHRASLREIETILQATKFNLAKE